MGRTGFPMRRLLLFLCLALPALCQTPTIEAIEWNRLQVEDGQRIMGRIVLSAPAQADSKVIFEPTFHLELPTVVPVAAGQKTIDFPVKIVDNRFLTGGSPDVPSVTAYFNGQLFEGSGPAVTR